MITALPSGAAVAAPEEKMSTLAASGIAMVGTCTSKGMLVIAFIVRITRECPAARAGMRRAVCRDVGCVQMCVYGQTWAVGVENVL